MQENGVLTRMAEMRLVCEREISIHHHKIDSSVTSRRILLDSAKSTAQQTIQLQGHLGKLKVELREVEDALVKALSVKNQKEGKRIAVMESISVIKTRIGELKGVVEDQRARKDEYATLISQQSEVLTACMEKCEQNREHGEQIEEAISWYNRVLGFRIECGRGVKFILTNISPEDPDKEYSFIVRHENEIYTLLDCDPHLNGTKEMVNELNKSNGLFKFVRTMRTKFQEAAACGVSLDGSSTDQDTSVISLSAPIASGSTDHMHESPPIKEKDLQCSELNIFSRKVGKGETILSPGSASSIRRSARLKARK